MAVAYYSCWFVNQQMSALEDAEEQLEITATVSDRADVEGRVEVAHILEHAAAERHVRASTVPSRSQVSRGSLAAFHIYPPVPAHETATKTVSFEQYLGLGLELVRHDQPCDRHHLGIPERTDQRPYPTRVDHHVVVRVGHDLPASLGDGSVACPVEAWSGLADVAHPRVGVFDQELGGVVARRVVDDQHVQVGVIQPNQRVEAYPQVLRTIARADGHGDQRRF